MIRNKLTTTRLALENIRRKPFRSLSLILLITLFSFSLIVGTILSMSLSRGVGSLSDRLGADVMVVPAGYETKIDSVLLSGTPSYFYLPANTLDKLKAIEGIEKMSPQTYIATLSASCCSYPVQIIGIDYNTDFLIKPWLSKTIDRELHYGEVIVGNHVAGNAGEYVQFFEKPFKIVGRLEQTGMGFDSTVFVTKETATDLAKAAQRILKHPLSEDGSLISTVMIKLKPGYDSIEVARKITKQFADDGIFGMFSKKFVNSISSNLSIITNYITLTIGLVWVLAIFVISLIFSIILNERKKEMAILRILGATKSKLSRLILTESFLISIYGTLIGAGLGIGSIIAFSPTIGEKLNIPFLIPPLPTLVSIIVVCILIGIATGPFASFYSAYKLSKIDVYKNIRDNE